MIEMYFDEILPAIAIALDTVEGELLGVTTHHGKRISTISLLIAERLGFSDLELSTLTGCALLHDNALTEYILSERPGETQELNMKAHCVYGERNASYFPFQTDPKDLILYHHERPDGKGPFNKREGEIPEGARIISLADSIDIKFKLDTIKPENIDIVIKEVIDGKGSKYDKEIADIFLDIFDEKLLVSLNNDNIHDFYLENIRPWKSRIGKKELVGLARIISSIIDYKSEFTKNHSIQIANKAWYMGEYYNYTDVEKAEMYLTAAIHDIGKLNIPTDILEKPGKLTDEEFEIVKSHVYWTHYILKDISGFEYICEWASNHHEKLDGSGYCRGLDEKDLDFNSRLLACIDIYQAVREKRPYHPPRNHKDTMEILYNDASRGKIDREIVKDIDKVFKELKDGEAPSPECGLI